MIEICVFQHVGEAIVFVLDVDKVAEASLVPLAAFLDVFVIGKQCDGRMAIKVKL